MSDELNPYMDANEFLDILDDKFKQISTDIDKIENLIYLIAVEHDALYNILIRKKIVTADEYEEIKNQLSIKLNKMKDERKKIENEINISIYYDNILKYGKSANS